jgi:hypothetical protein
MAQTHLTLEQLTFLTNNMATSLSLENDSSLAQGYIKVNGTTAATLTTSGITGNLTGNVTGNVTGSLTAGGSLTLATAQTASGTAVDFTGIPSWAKRITVMFNGVSGSGTSNFMVQLGDSGGIENTGYTGAVNRETNILGFSAGFILMFSNVAAVTNTIQVIISNINSNNWICSFISTRSDNAVSYGVGVKSLSDVLTQLRITTVNGTDTFDAGTINISYE